MRVSTIVVLFLCLNFLANLHYEYSKVSAFVIEKRSKEASALMKGFINRSITDKTLDQREAVKNDDVEVDDSYMSYYHIRMG